MSKLKDATWLEDHVGIPKARAWELARQNLIPHVRVGRQVRFVPEKIDQWIAAGGSPLPGGWRQEADA